MKNTGVIDLIHSGKADLGVGMIMASYNRMKKVNFLTPFYQQEVGFAISSEEYHHEQILWKSFKPFDAGTWLAVIISFLVVFILFHFIFRRQEDGNVADNLFHCVRMAICQGLPPRFSATTPTRILVSSFYIMGSILFTCYTANLIALSTIVRENMIDTFAKLANHPQYKLLFREGAYEILHTSRNPVVARVEKNHPSNLDDFIVKFSDFNYYDIAHQIVHEKVVFVADFDELGWICQKYCHISLSKERWSEFTGSFAVSKQFQYEKEFNIIIERLQESGIIEELTHHHRTRYFGQKKMCSSENDSWSMKDLSMGFAWMGIGLLLAVVVFVVEVAYGKCRS